MTNFEPDQNQKPHYRQGVTMKSSPMETALEAVATVATPANDTPAKGPETAPEGAGKKNKGGRPTKANKPTPWSIKGVDTESRAIITKAAERAGKTIGEYISNEVREYASGQIKKGKQPPASPSDVASMIDAQLKTLRVDIATDIAEAVRKATADSPERRGIFARWFGKS